MEFDELIYRFNPHLKNVDKTPQKYYNFNRDEIPYGKGEYETNYMEFENNSKPYPNIEEIINKYQQSQIKGEDSITVDDILYNKQASQQIINQKRAKADKLKLNQGVVKNTGQKYEDEIISDLTDNAINRQRLKVEQAQNIMEKHVKSRR